MAKNDHKQKGSNLPALLFIFILIIIVITVLYYNSQSGFINFSHSTISRTQDSIYTSILVNSDTQTKYSAYKDLVVFCDKQGLHAIDNKGIKKWQNDINLNTPFLSIADKYILVASSLGKDIYVINNGNIVHTSKILNNIINAKIKPSGNYVVICEESYYKGKIIVKNIQDELIFEWNSGNAYILDADISNNGKQLAVATLNTDGSICTNVLLFDTTRSEPYKILKFQGSTVANIKFMGDGRISAIADNKVFELSSNGNIVWEHDYSGKVLQKAKTEENCVVLALANSFGSNSTITVLDRRGQQRCSIDLNNPIKYIDITKNHITYNDKDNIAISSLSGKLLYHIDIKKDILNAVLYKNSKCLLGITSVSMDIINLK